MTDTIQTIDRVAEVVSIAVRLASAYCEFRRAYSEDNDDCEECEKKLLEVHKEYVVKCREYGIVETWTM